MGLFTQALQLLESPLGTDTGTSGSIMNTEVALSVLTQIEQWREEHDELFLFDRCVC